ncbi:hypothetical protein WJX72_008324 [[Myrmecia] bisecta]|uniref:Uncharacterized protein n=1 Tax=[Myrmecia] bisecta TaxID=41462 RepID=A0AAW1PLJ5_9CHLO
MAAHVAVFTRPRVPNLRPCQHQAQRPAQSGHLAVCRPSRLVQRSPVRKTDFVCRAESTSDDYVEAPGALLPHLPTDLAASAKAGFMTLALAGSSMSLASAALADEGLAPSPARLPFNPFEIGLLLTPLVLYGGFNIYRTNVNPRAKLSDFLFIFAALVIFGNLLSILVFKVRFF